MEPGGNACNTRNERIEGLIGNNLRLVSGHEARAEEARVIKCWRHLWPDHGAARRDDAQFKFWTGERSKLGAELCRRHQRLSEDINSDHRCWPNLGTSCLAIGPSLVWVWRCRSWSARSGGDARWLATKVFNHGISESGCAHRRLNIAPLLAHHILRERLPLFKCCQDGILHLIGKIEFTNVAKHRC